MTIDPKDPAIKIIESDGGASFKAYESVRVEADSAWHAGLCGEAAPTSKDAHIQFTMPGGPRHLEIDQDGVVRVDGEVTRDPHTDDTRALRHAAEGFFGCDFREAERPV
ncbi:MAG TPA: hypothetical protein VIU64_06575 [Polyangia bacterium]